MGSIGISRRLLYRLAKSQEALRSGGAGAFLRYMSSRLVADITGTVHRTGVWWRSSHGMVLAKTDVGAMFLLTDDSGISRQLIKHGRREEGLVNLLRQVIRPGMVGLDIGANVGYFVLLESSLVGKTGAIYAIEPVPDNLNVLGKNVAHNALSNVTIVAAAAGQKDGEGEIHLAQASNLASMRGPQDSGLLADVRMGRTTWRPVSVEVVSGDSLIQARSIGAPDFIRIDVEGYEFEVLAGLRKTLSQRDVPLKLIIEVHNMLFADIEGTVEPWLLELMSYGFRAKAIINENDILPQDDDEAFIRSVCSYRKSCPQVYLERT